MSKSKNTQLEQLDKMYEAQEASKALDVGLAMTNQLVNSLVQAGKISDMAMALKEFETSLPKVRKMLQDNMKTLRQSLEELAPVEEPAPKEEAHA